MSDKDLLDELLKDKTPEEREKLQKDVLVGKLAGYLHTLLCARDHEKDCDFYQEEQLMTQSRARINWTSMAERLLEKSGVLTLSDMTVIMIRIPSVLPLLMTDPKLLKLILELQPIIKAWARATRDALLAGPSSCQADLSNSA